MISNDIKNKSRKLPLRISFSLSNLHSFITCTRILDNISTIYMTTYDDCVYENSHPSLFSLRLPGSHSPAQLAPEGLAVRLWGSTIP